MNLRVRSVTVCSRSAMFVGCIVLLAKTLDIKDVYAVTHTECIAGSSMVEKSRVVPSVICVCAK